MAVVAENGTTIRSPGAKDGRANTNFCPDQEPPAGSAPGRGAIWPGGKVISSWTLDSATDPIFTNVAVNGMVAPPHPYSRSLRSSSARVPAAAVATARPAGIGVARPGVGAGPDGWVGTAVAPGGSVGTVVAGGIGVFAGCGRCVGVSVGMVGFCGCLS